MKSILTIVLALALGSPSLSEISDVVKSGSRLTTSYALAYSEDGVQVLLNGKALVQGECYRIEGNGVEIYCDGKAVWIVDRKAKEVYVESPASLQDFVASRISSIRDFNLSDTKTAPALDNPGEFTFSTDSLGPEWVVTDLR